MHYFVKTETDDRGNHVVHFEECQFLPIEINRTPLGDFAKCDTAMDHAHEEYDQVEAATLAPPIAIPADRAD